MMDREAPLIVFGAVSDMTVFIKLESDQGIYQRGDRVPWCEGCYGFVLAKIGNQLVIRTDDGADRITNEHYTMLVEKQLADRGVRWK